MRPLFTRHTSRLVTAVAAVLGTALGHATTLSAQGGLRGYPATPDVAMRIYVPKGRITITTWARDSIAVHGSVGSNATLFGGGDRGHVKLGVETRRADDPTLPSAELTFVVPQGARVWIKTIDGTIDVRGVAGELEAYAVRGSITVQAVRGSTTIESIDAPVRVTDARGALRVRGSRGAVSLEAIHGTASIATISGAVTATDLAADARVETVGGTVRLRGPIAGATVDIQTHQGAIELYVDPGASPLLDLSSRSGTVRGANVPGAAKQGRIIARSFKGDIRVERVSR